VIAHPTGKFDNAAKGYQHIEAVPLSAAMGAEIRGVDLANLRDEQFDEIERALFRHKMIYFRDQKISHGDQEAFSLRFGPFAEDAYTKGVDGHENVQPVIKEADSKVAMIFGSGWHTDSPFLPQPPAISMLYGVDIPPFGGDTMWANLYQAFDELSPPLRDLCEGLSALHNAEPHGKPEVMTVHPVVRVHPETGRKVLYVNEHFTRRIVELSHRESDMLLGYLTRWVSNPRFTVRYHWTKGTVAMWDNRCTQHFVLNDFDEERIIQRVTVMGDQPEPASPPRWQPYLRERHAGATSRFDRQLNQYLGQRAQSLESNRKDDA